MAPVGSRSWSWSWSRADMTAAAATAAVHCLMSAGGAELRACISDASVVTWTRIRSSKLAAASRVSQGMT